MWVTGCWWLGVPGQSRAGKGAVLFVLWRPAWQRLEMRAAWSLCDQSHLFCEPGDLRDMQSVEHMLIIWIDYTRFYLSFEVRNTFNKGLGARKVVLVEAFAGVGSYFPSSPKTSIRAPPVPRCQQGQNLQVQCLHFWLNKIWLMISRVLNRFASFHTDVLHLFICYISPWCSLPFWKRFCACWWDVEALK